MKHVFSSIGRTLVVVSAVMVFIAGGAVAQSTPQPPITIKIIGFNDFHGALQSPGTFGINTLAVGAQRPAVGGVDYIAAYVA